MILKIERHSKKSNQDWLVFDKIDKISKSCELYADITYEHLHTNIALIDHKDLLTKNNQYKYIELICKKENGDEFSIDFDTIAYICNDQGKTIERIFVNC